MALNFSPPAAPVGIILDTDMATDCDDAGAMALLHNLAAQGEAEILAVVCNNRDEHSIGAVAAINAFYGRPGIPLGAYQGNEVGADCAGFVRGLAMDRAAYKHRIQSRKQAAPAVEVYRQTLAEASGQVILVSIGHLNNLRELVESGADSHSPLCGLELIRGKVKHLVVMGGDYPEGKEHNFAARASGPSASAALRRWPGLILFSGYGLGERLITGPGLARLPEGHPVRRAYAGHSSKPLEKGRPSWDQAAVLAAVRGVSPYWRLSPPGTNTVSADGRNRFVETAGGRHAYLIEAQEPGKTAEEMECLMLGSG